jgi:soluble lytic murein transglycosylase-like protein
MVVRGLEPFGNFIFVAAGAALFCISCVSTRASRDTSATPPAVSADELTRELQSKQSLARQAELFDLFTRDVLETNAREVLIASCGKTSSNPFCFSIARFGKWSRFQRKHVREPAPFAEKVITPHRVEIKNGQVMNWRTIRHAEKQSLIKGLEVLPLDELRIVAGKALGERYCPNMGAIAAAAALEDHLANSQGFDEIARLYEHGARCFRSSVADRENFLVRAALLRFGEKKYAAAAGILARVTPSDAFAGRALYWLFRGYEAQNEKTKALTTYRKLRQRYPFSFHALAAAVEMGEDAAEPWIAQTATSPLKRSSNPTANRIVQQIEILHSFGYHDTSAVLVDWVLDDFPKLNAKHKLYLANLGDNKTKVDLLTNLFIRHRTLVNQETLRMAFPKPFEEAFKLSAGNTDPYLLLAIARKESKFDPLALSPANARGVMQLTEKTARELGTRDSSDLFDPAVNISAGSKYIEQLRHRWDARAHLMLAHYNAGEKVVESWFKRYDSDDALWFIDLIPYRETREYVGFVLANYYWYRRLYSQVPIAKIVAPDIARK